MLTPVFVLGTEPANTAVALTVTNAGRRPVTIQDVGFTGTKAHRKFRCPSLLGSLPLELTEGQARVLLLTMQDRVKADLAAMQGVLPKRTCVRDGTGCLHTWKNPLPLRDSLWEESKHVTISSARSPMASRRQSGPL